MLNYGTSNKRFDDERFDIRCVNDLEPSALRTMNVISDASSIKKRRKEKYSVSQELARNQNLRCIGSIESAPEHSGVPVQTKIVEIMHRKCTEMFRCSGAREKRHFLHQRFPVRRGVLQTVLIEFDYRSNR